MADFSKTLIRCSSLSCLFISCSIYCQAQFKIGTITVSESVATQYLLDCYNRPDTVYEQNEYTYLCYNCTVTNDQIQDARARAFAFNSELKRMSIGKLEWSIPQRYLVPRKPSEQDFIKWLKRQKN